uniref:TF-B3 domain-containing protein n=1 Tax=Caenorhabditis tropicalis TaxID=1561998 RepID=A0A1I7UEA5_9PELO
MEGWYRFQKLRPSNRFFLVFQEKGDFKTAEIGTNCRILITPRVEEVEEEVEEEKISNIGSSPLCSPISTVHSDLSEGEMKISAKKVIVVRPDGSIVPTPRAIEDIGYDGDYDRDVLIAKSSSSFGVAEVDLSISSAHSH